MSPFGETESEELGGLWSEQQHNMLLELFGAEKPGRACTYIGI